MSTSLAELLRSVLPLALGAAVSPVILLLQMVTLTTGTSRLARAWLVAAGAALALAGWGLAGWLLVNRLPTPRVGPDATAAAVDLTLALVLVALGIRAVVGRHDPAPAPAAADDAASAPPRLLTAFGLGVAAMASNVTTIVLFLPAVRDIARARVATLDTVVALVVLFAVTLAPALLPVLAVSLGGAAGRRVLDRVGEFARVHHAAIAAVVSFAFAVYLGLKGLQRL
jgi:hypothetical protein